MSKFDKLQQMPGNKDSEFLVATFSYYTGKEKKSKSIENKRTYVLQIGKTFLFNQEVFLVIFNDQTKKEMIGYLKEMNNYKNNVLASISHELRTPLNGSLAFLRSLEASKQIPEEEKQRLVHPAISCSLLQLTLIDNILDFT